MNKLSVLFIFAFFIGTHALTVDSLTIDSVWNSDSISRIDTIIKVDTTMDTIVTADTTIDTIVKADTTMDTIFFRQSRDCFVGFKPIGQGMAECYIALSIDSGKTWAPKPNPLIMLDSGIASPILCGTKGRIKLRMTGGDRNNVIFKITARQYQRIISRVGPRFTAIGLTSPLTPGNSCTIPVTVKLDSITHSPCLAPLTKVYWDAFGDSTWDDSTSALNWVWQANVPMGILGQRKDVIVKAKDLNGLWSNPCTLTVDFGLQRTVNMVSITGAAFQMGSSRETPIHSATITGFKMSEAVVTQELYRAVVGANPSYFEGDTSALRPVEQVSWYDAALFCNALSNLLGKDTVYQYAGTINSSVAINYVKNGYRLPTEAEWEYACRAGTTTDYCWGKNYPPSTPADTLSLDSNAIWSHNSHNMTQPVASKKPNAWGLYDMSGNIYQWVNDWYGDYAAGAQTDPTGPATSSGSRILRGGSWATFANGLRSSYRLSDAPGVRDYYTGFRLASRP